MVHDIARAVSTPVIEPAGQDTAQVPAPRAPVLESAAGDTSRPARRPGYEPAARERPRAAQGSRAGWIVLTVVAAAASWAVGWVSGVTWAWRAMTPRHLRRNHRRQGARLATSGSPSL